MPAALARHNISVRPANLTGACVITYRPLNAGDRDFCVRVHHLALRAYVEAICGWNEALQDVLAFEFINHPNATHEIAVVNGVPIGYLSYQDKADGLVLNKLHLHPDHQGRGHGAEILRRPIGLACSRNKPLELSVLTTNPRARAFYGRHGFTVVSATAEKARMRRAKPT